MFAHGLSSLTRLVSGEPQKAMGINSVLMIQLYSFCDELSEQSKVNVYDFSVFSCWLSHKDLEITLHC